MKKLICITALFSLVSCNDDDLLDFYSSQSRSVEFFGKWKQKDTLKASFGGNEWEIYVKIDN